VLNRLGKNLIETVAASQDDENGYQPPRPPDEEQKALLKDMQSKVADCANDLDIAAETVASKRELSSVISSGSHDSRVFQGWRREIIGEQLLQLL
jgi:ribonuclease D